MLRVMEKNPHYYYLIILIYITPLCIMVVAATIWNYFDNKKFKEIHSKRDGNNPR